MDDVINHRQESPESGVLDFGASIQIVRVDPRTPNHGGDDIGIPAAENEQNARIERANHRRGIQRRESVIVCCLGKE